MNYRSIIVFMFALFVWALCACGQGLQRGIEITEKGAKILDVSLDVGTSAWTAAVEGQVAHCRAKDLATPEDRRACMGIFADGEKVVPALREASEAYDALVEALDTLGKAAAELRPYLDAAAKEND